MTLFRALFAERRYLRTPWFELAHRARGWELHDPVLVARDADAVALEDYVRAGLEEKYGRRESEQESPARRRQRLRSHFRR